MRARRPKAVLPAYANMPHRIQAMLNGNPQNALHAQSYGLHCMTFYAWTTQAPESHQNAPRRST